MNWEKLHFPTGSSEKLRVVRWGKHLPDSDCGICICACVCVCAKNCINNCTASGIRPKNAARAKADERKFVSSQSLYLRSTISGCWARARAGGNICKEGRERWGILTLRLLLLQGVHACRRWCRWFRFWNCLAAANINAIFHAHIHSHTEGGQQRQRCDVRDCLCHRHLCGKCHASQCAKRQYKI